MCYVGNVRQERFQSPLNGSSGCAVVLVTYFNGKYARESTSILEEKGADSLCMRCHGEKHR